MAGRKAGRQKQQDMQIPKEKLSKPLRFGKMEFFVGAKVEALENKHWYAAKVIKINEKDRKVLIHFEGWNQRYDCWLPIHSPKLKASTKQPVREVVYEETEKEYGIGDHVLARWANGKFYSAEIVRSVGDGNFEVLFFDGFRKVVSKSSIKVDKKKTYKNLEQSPRQETTATTTTSKPRADPCTIVSDASGGSRLRRPVAMADFVTGLTRKNKRRSDQDDSPGGSGERHISEFSEMKEISPVHDDEGKVPLRPGRGRKRSASSMLKNSSQNSSKITQRVIGLKENTSEICVTIKQDVISTTEKESRRRGDSNPMQVGGKDSTKGVLSPKESDGIPYSPTAVSDTYLSQLPSGSDVNTDGSPVENVGQDGPVQKRKRGRPSLASKGLQLKSARKGSVVVSFDWKKSRSTKRLKTVSDSNEKLLKAGARSGTTRNSVFSSEALVSKQQSTTTPSSITPPDAEDKLDFKNNNNVEGSTTSVTGDSASKLPFTAVKEHDPSRVLKKRGRKRKRRFGPRGKQLQVDTCTPAGAEDAGAIGKEVLPRSSESALTEPKSSNPAELDEVMSVATGTKQGASAVGKQSSSVRAKAPGSKSTVFLKRGRKPRPVRSRVSDARSSGTRAGQGKEVISEIGDTAVSEDMPLSSVVTLNEHTCKNTVKETEDGDGDREYNEAQVETTGEVASTKLTKDASLTDVGTESKTELVGSNIRKGFEESNKSPNSASGKTKGRVVTKSKPRFVSSKTIEESRKRSHFSEVTRTEKVVSHEPKKGVSNSMSVDADMKSKDRASILTSKDNAGKSSIDEVVDPKDTAVAKGKIENDKVSPLESLTMLVSSQHMEKQRDNIENRLSNMSNLDEKETQGKTCQSSSIALPNAQAVGSEKAINSDTSDQTKVKGRAKSKGDSSGTASGKKGQRSSSKGQSTFASMVEQDRPSQVEHSTEEMKRILARKIEREQPLNKDNTQVKTDDSQPLVPPSVPLQKGGDVMPQSHFYAAPPLQFRQHINRESSSELANVPLYANTGNCRPPSIPSSSFGNPVLPAPPPRHEMYMCSCGSPHPVGFVYHGHMTPPVPPAPQPALLECTDPKCIGHHAPSPPIFHSSPPPLRVYQPSPPLPPPRSLSPFDVCRRNTQGPAPPLPQIQDVMSLSTASVRSPTDVAEVRVDDNVSSRPADSNTSDVLDIPDSECRASSEEVQINDDGLHAKVNNETFQAKKKRLDMITGKLSAQKVVKKEVASDIPKSDDKKDPSESPLQRTINNEKESSVTKSATTPDEGLDNRNIFSSTEGPTSTSSRHTVPFSGYKHQQRSSPTNAGLYIQTPDYPTSQLPDIAGSSYVSPQPFAVSYSPEGHFVSVSNYPMPRVATPALSTPMESRNPVPGCGRQYQPLLPKVPLSSRAPGITFRPVQYGAVNSLPGVSSYGRPRPPQYFGHSYSGHDHQQMVGNYSSYPPRFAVEPLRYYPPVPDVAPPSCNIRGCHCMSARSQQKSSWEPTAPASSATPQSEAGVPGQDHFCSVNPEHSSPHYVGRDVSEEAEKANRPPTSKKSRKSDKPMPTMAHVTSAPSLEEVETSRSEEKKDTAAEDEKVREAIVGKPHLRSTKLQTKEGVEQSMFDKRETRRRATSVSLSRAGAEADVKGLPIYKKSMSKDSAILNKRKEKEHVLAPKEFVVDLNLNEFKCHVKGCDKSFRKSNLLDYHVKYFHSPRQSLPVRKRSSVSMSSNDSTSGCSLQSPVEGSAHKKAKRSPDAGEIKPAEDVSKTCEVNVVSVLPEEPLSDGDKGEDSWEDSTLESDGESDSSDISDVIRCLCQDDDEQGFMIQCEQCYTWQHGDCVHLNVESVPHRYLCYMCRDPKGLRKSEKYKNDFEWFRHGTLPQISSKCVKDDKLDDIILASHVIASDVANVSECLHGIKQKLNLLKSPSHVKLKFWMKPAKSRRSSLSSELEVDDVDVLTTINPPDVTKTGPNSNLHAENEIEPRRDEESKGKMKNNDIEAIESPSNPVTSSNNASEEMSESKAMENYCVQKQTEAEKTGTEEESLLTLTQCTEIKQDTTTKDEDSKRSDTTNKKSDEQTVITSEPSQLVEVKDQGTKSERLPDSQETVNVKESNPGSSPSTKKSRPSDHDSTTQQGNEDRSKLNAKDELNDPHSDKGNENTQQNEVTTDDDSCSSDSETDTNVNDKELLYAQSALLSELDIFETEIKDRLDDLEQGVAVLEAEYELTEEGKTRDTSPPLASSKAAHHLRNLIQKFNVLCRDAVGVF